MLRTLATVFAGLLGLAFGSFLNVCLSRWPEGESVVAPRSHCRHCDHTLSWWENIPLLSWLALRGRCRQCRTPIAWRYPLVELLVGALWAASAWHWAPFAFDPKLPVGSTWFALTQAGAGMAFAWLLVALALLDAEHLWLPNFLTIPGVILGLLVTTARAALPVDRDAQSQTGGALLAAVIAIAICAGLILLIRALYKLLRRREGMGLGDAKLMALLAAWLGLPGALLAFALGALIGTAVALALLAVPKLRRTTDTWAATKLPFGTFLCIGGIVSALWGQTILQTYLRWSGF